MAALRGRRCRRGVGVSLPAATASEIRIASLRRPARRARRRRWASRTCPRWRPTPHRWPTHRRHPMLARSSDPPSARTVANSTTTIRLARPPRQRRSRERPRGCLVCRPESSSHEFRTGTKAAVAFASPSRTAPLDPTRLARVSKVRVRRTRPEPYSLALNRARRSRCGGRTRGRRRSSRRRSSRRGPRTGEDAASRGYSSSRRFPALADARFV